MVERNHAMTEAERRYYRAWAEPWFTAVRGNVGYIEGDVFHLWHGELVNRRASERHRALAAHGFDPHTDISLPPSGALRWASDKPALHQYLRDYFENRKEDG